MQQKNYKYNSTFTHSKMCLEDYYSYYYHYYYHIIFLRQNYTKIITANVYNKKIIYIYIYIYIYIFTTEGLFEVAIESWPQWDLNPRPILYMFTNLPVDTIVRLPLPRSGESQGQKTFLAPSADKQSRNYDTECSNHHPSLSILRPKRLSRSKMKW